LPNYAPRSVPGWRPCGSNHEDASAHPGRWAAHGAWLAERRRAMIAIVPAPCHDGGNATSDTASAGGVCADEGRVRSLWRMLEPWGGPRSRGYAANPRLTALRGSPPPVTPCPPPPSPTPDLRLSSPAHASPWSCPLPTRRHTSAAALPQRRVTGNMRRPPAAWQGRCGHRGHCAQRYRRTRAWTSGACAGWALTPVLAQN
jgi:hypothetical protein